MNIIDENKYKELCYILSGCRNILDAHYFVELYTNKNADMKNLAYSIIYGKKYDNVLDFKTMQNCTEILNNCNDFTNENISSYEKHTNADIIQKKCFSRILKNKIPVNKLEKPKTDNRSYLKLQCIDLKNEYTNIKNIISKKMSTL